MKFKLLAALLLLSTAMLAQTTYIATGGTVHPYPAISVTMELGNNPYTEYALAQYGSGFNVLNYFLPDGESAKNLVFSSATTTTLPGYKRYQVSGTASGTDSTGAAVTVFITYVYHVGGSGRYTVLVFDSGNLEVTKTQTGVGSNGDGSPIPTCGGPQKPCGDDDE